MTPATRLRDRIPTVLRPATRQRPDLGESPPTPDTCPMSKPPAVLPDVAFYADGSIQWRGSTLDGEMHGTWEFFRRDGSVMRTGDFDRGRQVGTWRTFDRAGRLVKETSFDRG
jgi:hypothetical protein